MGDKPIKIEKLEGMFEEIEAGKVDQEYLTHLLNVHSARGQRPLAMALSSVRKRNTPGMEDAETLPVAPQTHVYQAILTYGALDCQGEVCDDHVFEMIGVVPAGLTQDGEQHYAGLDVVTGKARELGPVSFEVFGESSSIVKSDRPDLGSYCVIERKEISDEMQQELRKMIRW